MSYNDRYNDRSELRESMFEYYEDHDPREETDHDWYEESNDGSNYEDENDDDIPTEPTDNSDIDLNDLVGKTIKDRVFSQVADFKDKKFKGTTFENVTFLKAVFKKTTIFENTKFVNCNLVDATFNDETSGRKMHLKNVEITGCNFKRSTFNHCRFENLSVSSLPLVRDTSLDESTERFDNNFSHAIFKHCEFENFKVNKSNFSSTWFDKCDFLDLEILNCDFSGSKFEGEPDFTKVSKFSKNKIEDTIFVYSGLEGANFKRMDLKNVDFDWTRLKKANFEGCLLNQVNYGNADLTEANFIWAKIIDASFFRSTLKKTKFEYIYPHTGGAEDAQENQNFIDFTESELNGAKFSHSLLQKFNFGGATLVETSFENSTLQKFNFEGAKLIETSFKKSRLKDVNFEEATLLRVDFQDTFFDTVKGFAFKEIELSADEKHMDAFREEYTIQEYVEENVADNIVIKLDKMILLTKRIILKNFINVKDCENGIVYICKKVYDNFYYITKKQLRDETPYLNMRKLGLFVGLVPVKEIEYMIKSKEKYFTMERTKEKETPSVVSFSVYSPDCSVDVMSRSHCQAGQGQPIYEINNFKPKFVTSEQLETSPKTPRLVSSLGRDEVSRPQRTPPRSSPRTQRTIPTTPPRSLRTDGIVARRRMPTPTSSSLPLLDIERIPRTPSPDLDIPRSRNPSFSDESNGDRLGGGRGRRNRTTKTKRLNKKKTHKLKSFRIRLRTKKGKRNKMRKTHKKRKYYKQR
jgi:uncharacterized protein YjbI with pentapeptide repeats